MPHTRLTTRRGSVSASDPHGTHAKLNLDPNRSSSSTLTIVRVVPTLPLTTNLTLQDPPAFRSRRRHGSTSSLGSNSSRENTTNSSPRLSFAFTSFSGHGPSPGGPATSPSTSPRIRPSSPTLTRSSSHHSRSYSHSRSKLSPEQLYDLARQATNPRTPPPGSPSTPGSAYSSHSEYPTVEKASFTPLADDVYLPFIDRPMEVSALISSPPSAKLFSLLAQTFPRNMADVESEPSTWSYSHLVSWLTSVDRTAAPDAVWVHTARTCILSHSELIWERVKGALGVPPELDVEEDEVPNISFEEEEEDEPTIANDDKGDQNIDDEEGDGFDPSYSPALSIEHVYATPAGSTTTTPASINPPPLSLPVSLSYAGSDQGVLQDIGEEEEEEEEKSAAKAAEAAEEERLAQGLRIQTHPQRSSTLRDDIPTSQRKSSSGTLPPFERIASFPGAGGPSLASWIAGTADEAAYNPVGDRGPGNPLFPSSFARLAVGPTLRANNPSLRSPAHPPAPAYGANPHAIRLGTHGKPKPRVRRPPSWVAGWEPGVHEYAITVASSSSVGGD